MDPETAFAIATTEELIGGSRFICNLTFTAAALRSGTGWPRPIGGGDSDARIYRP